MQTLDVIFLIIIMSLACGYFAKKRGRNPTTWMVAGLFFGILALVALFIMPVVKPNAKLTNQKSVAPKPLLTILQPDHTEKLWYFLDEERQQFGPMSFDALGKAWTEGKVREKTYVWNEAMENWQHFQDVIRSS